VAYTNESARDVTNDLNRVTVTGAMAVTLISSPFLRQTGSNRAGGRDTRPVRVVVCDGRAYSERSGSGAADGERGQVAAAGTAERGGTVLGGAMVGAAAGVRRRRGVTRPASCLFSFFFSFSFFSYFTITLGRK
jgi:hypothetical protein